MNALSHPGCLRHWRIEKNALTYTAMFVFICISLVSTHPTSLSVPESFRSVAVVNDRTLHGQRVNKVRPANSFSILQEL